MSNYQKIRYINFISCQLVIQYFFIFTYYSDYFLYITLNFHILFEIKNVHHRNKRLNYVPTSAEILRKKSTR